MRHRERERGENRGSKTNELKHKKGKVIENREDNEKGVKKGEVLHKKVAHNKRSTAGLKQLHTKILFHCNTAIQGMGTMWVCIHPVPLTPPWWLMKLTQGFQLFMTWGLNYLLGWCMQANCVSIRSRSPSVGISWLGSPLISETLSLFPTSAPRSLQQLLWVDARCSCGHVWERDEETEEEKGKRLS